MVLKSIAMTLLKVEHKSGTGKASGKPYDFYTATLVDDDSNVFALNVSDDITSMVKDMSALRNVEVVVDVDFKPKGFGISGTLTSIVPKA